MQIVPNELTSDSSGRQLRTRTVKHTKVTRGVGHIISRRSFRPKTRAMLKEEEHEEQHSPLLIERSPVHEQSPSQLNKRNGSHTGLNSSRVHFTGSTHTSPIRQRLNSSVSEELELLSTEERNQEYIERVTIFPEQTTDEPVDNDSGISELGGEDHPLSGEVGLRHGKSGKETVCSILTQVAIPFVIAGFGMMAAGLLLDAVQVSGMLKHLHTILYHKPIGPLFIH